MPCTRSGNEFVTAPLDYDSDDDPDYREESDDSDADDLPRTMWRDRADWIVQNQDAIADLFHVIKAAGQVVFGGAFLQTANINHFANFVYKYTTPGAN